MKKLLLVLGVVCVSFGVWKAAEATVYTFRIMRPGINILGPNSDPSGAKAGDVYFNNNAVLLKYYDGSTWDTIVNTGNLTSYVLKTGDTMTGTLNNFLSSSVVGAVIKGASGQSADLMDFKNNAGTVLANVDASGNITASSFSGPLTGNVTGNTSGTANNVTGTVAVANGGTGDTSFTAYALLAGGTTATGVLQQVSGLGSAGQILTSQGAGALPHWANNTGATTYAPTTQIFSSPNYYTFTVTAANATAGATYTNNGVTFTVIYTISGGTTLVCSGSSAPLAGSSTLTKSTGTGDSSISYSSFASNGTYQLPSNPAPLWIKVRMVGAGGSGGSSGSSGTATGANGGSTSFGSYTAGGGSGGAPGTGSSVGTGGGGGVNSGGPQIDSTGQDGENGLYGSGSASTAGYGGDGSNSVLGAGGRGQRGAAGSSAVSFGGGGAGGGPSSSTFPAGGGGAGGYVEQVIGSPSSTYTFNVGKKGGTTSAGTSGFLGGSGSSGVIIVEEHYQ